MDDPNFIARQLLNRTIMVHDLWTQAIGEAIAQARIEGMREIAKRFNAKGDHAIASCVEKLIREFEKETG